MNGLSVQLAWNSSGERSGNRVIWFRAGILETYGSSEMCAQLKGRYRESENSWEQSTTGTLDAGMLRYVERHVPLHVKSSLGSLRGLVSQGS
jgi:hypothetical protein